MSSNGIGLVVVVLVYESLLKVANLDVGYLISHPLQYDILRTYLAMNNTLLVQVLDHAQQLLHQVVNVLVLFQLL